MLITPNPREPLEPFNPFQPTRIPALLPFFINPEGLWTLSRGRASRPWRAASDGPTRSTPGLPSSHSAKPGGFVEISRGQVCAAPGSRRPYNKAPRQGRGTFPSHTRCFIHPPTRPYLFPTATWLISSLVHVKLIPAILIRVNRRYRRLNLCALCALSPACARVIAITYTHPPPPTRSPPTTSNPSLKYKRTWLNNSPMSF